MRIKYSSEDVRDLQFEIFMRLIDGALKRYDPKQDYSLTQWIERITLIMALRELRKYKIRSLTLNEL